MGAEPRAMGQPFSQGERGAVAPRRRRRRKGRGAALLMIGLTAALAVVFLVGVFVTVKVLELDQANNQLRQQLKASEAALAEIAPEFERLRAAQREMALGRLPGLRELVFDEVLPVGDGHVRSVIFTLGRTDGEARYHYQMVLENYAREAAWAEVGLRLFDDAGIQVGQVDVLPLGSAALAPGETRSEHGVVPVLPGTVPSYFIVVGGSGGL